VVSYAAFRGAAALGLTAIGCKAALVALRLHDGGGDGLRTPWAVIALLHEDALLAVVFGAVSWAILRFRARRGLGVVFAVLCFWMAFNVPVARLFSTPATYGMLSATGGALADSFAVYLTVANLAIPAALWLGGLWLWRRWTGGSAEVARGQPDPIAIDGHGFRRVAAVALAAFLLAAGPVALARVETTGLHRNAVVTLLTSGVAHQVASLAARPLGERCAAAEGAATDLRDLAGAARGRNVVLVILESTGTRFLGAYGAARPSAAPGLPAVTPHLDALAADAVLFDHAYAAYPESIKGLFALLCSRAPPPHTHAAQYHAARTSCASLAAGMAGAGYHTGLFHSGRFAYLGMAEVVNGRGFAVLADAAAIPSPHVSSFGVDDLSTARAVLDFVDRRPAARPFFAVYMPIAGHHPYRSPGDGPRPFPERAQIDQYANDLHAGDAAFGELRRGLVARGLDQQTLYLVIGDHGEAFQEHDGNFAHALFLYEENVRVPFFAAAPGLWRGQRRAPQVASLLDLAPTLLALVGAAPAPAGYEGGSLLDPRPRVARFSTDQGLWQVGLREGAWKFIHQHQTGRDQLYDLRADPAERRNLAAEQRPRVTRYRRCLGV
jgi:lipoteichoic acid synthase